ncbi:MAG: 4'-phosphopantetheinyl transferase superfamily protein [Desulfobacteraceae bacterium]|jgi:4'-phosphopantetheinyl transferase
MNNPADRVDFYHIRRFQDGIALCFVHIPAFAASHIPDLDLASFRRVRAMILDETGPLSRYFTADDFQRINHFKVMKKQVEWMAGKAAVKILACERGLAPEADIRIAAEDNGAPFLMDSPDIPISISHSGDYAVCAMGEHGGIVAADIEQIEPGRMQTFVGVAFSDQEIQLLQGRSDQDHYLAWTMKEAFLKYIKKGFAEGLKKVEIMDGQIIHHGQPVLGIEIHSELFERDYALTLIWRK